MSLWVDKHRPKTLAKLDFHQRQAAMLSKLVKTNDLPHLLFCGPPGAGKKTRINAVLRELYGSGAERLRIEHQNFETPSKKKLEILSLASNYHIEINPSDAGVHDRVVIQEVIKTIAQTAQLDASQQKSFKVVVIVEVDQLTKDAQHALRRTMEKYISVCRLILSCNSITKVTPAVRSRCLIVRVPAPDRPTIVKILQSTCKKEGLNLPTEFGERVVDNCGRNLRKALLMCEACRVQQYPFTMDQEIRDVDWSIYLKQTAGLIIDEQSPKRLLEVRGRIYTLLAHCIPSSIILQELTDELCSASDDVLRSRILQLASTYDHRLQQGQKAIFHIEAFIAKFMSTYKSFIDDICD